MRRIFPVLTILVLLGHVEIARAAKEKFDRTKPHVNVGTIGHVDHGKTTLTAAITKILSALGAPTFPPLPQVDNGSENGAQGVRRSSCDVEYETGERIYRHFDCNDRESFAGDWIGGAAPMDDGAILVVDAADGPTPQTREHILLARQVGVPAMVVFIDQIHLINDPQLLELLEREVRELLSMYDFPGEDTPFVYGDILGAQAGEPDDVAAILQLVDALDLTIPQPPPLADRPFLMPIEDVFSIAGRGTVATGRIERGVVAPGDLVEVVGLMAPRSVDVAGLRGKNDEGMPGDKVGVALRGVAKEEVERGQVLAKPGSVRAHTKFKAEIYVLDKNEGGRHTPFFSGYRPQFYFRTADVTGAVELPPGVAMVFPGDHSEMTVELDEEIALEQGLRFTIGDPRRQVGLGIVTELPD